MPLKEFLKEETCRIVGFIKRDFQIWRSYSINFVLGLFGLVFYILFLFFLSRNITFFSTSTSEYTSRQTVAANTYFAFLLTGASLWPYASISLFGIADAIRKENTSGTIEPLFATPVSLRTYAVSSILWDFFYTTITVIFIVFSGFYIFNVPLTVTAASIPALLLVIVSMAVSLLAFGLMAAGLRLVFKIADPLSFLFGWFNTLITGIYFPTAILPTWAQIISLAHPLTYALSAYRSILLEGALLSNTVVQWDIVHTLAIGLILLPLGYLVFKRCFLKARRDASLRQY